MYTLVTNSMKNQFGKVSASPALGNLDGNTLESLLNAEDLGVENEGIVLKAIVVWLEAQKANGKDASASKLNSLLLCLRAEYVPFQTMWNVASTSPELRDVPFFAQMLESRMKQAFGSPNKHNTKDTKARLSYS